MHVIHPADGVYRQAEALVGPIALPETSPPVVVVRTAVPVEAKTMNMMMEICAASVRQGRTGVTDAHAMIWDYGKHQVMIDCTFVNDEPELMFQQSPKILASLQLWRTG